MDDPEVVQLAGEAGVAVLGHQVPFVGGLARRLCRFFLVLGGMCLPFRLELRSLATDGGIFLPSFS
jgi:hypothetical protein